jgi:pyrroloquinoline quinone (PQQ) biosynthesis protein C
LTLSAELILSFYEEFPSERHPLWMAVLGGKLTLEQILRAETQHFLRSVAGARFRLTAAEQAKSVSAKAHELLMETYKEECTHDETGPSHADLIKRFLLIGDITEEQLANAIPTPANAAAIALYKDISDRGPIHHMLGAGAVEYFYSALSPKIFEAYTTKYAISADQAHTYLLHGPMDRIHAERALSIMVALQLLRYSCEFHLGQILLEEVRQHAKEKISHRTTPPKMRSKPPKRDNGRLMRQTLSRGHSTGLLKRKVPNGLQKERIPGVHDVILKTRRNNTFAQPYSTAQISTSLISRLKR